MPGAPANISVWCRTVTSSTFCSPRKSNDRAPGIVDRKPGRISVCGRKMDTERSCGPHYRRGTRHDPPPAPVRKRGPDASDWFRSGIIHTSFRKLDNRAIGRRLPGRTAINDYIRGLPAEAWTRKGTANNLSITARALAYGVAGHELHHMAVIRNRYLSYRRLRPLEWN